MVIAPFILNRAFVIPTVRFVGFLKTKIIPSLCFGISKKNFKLIFNLLTKIVKVAFHLFFSPTLGSNFENFRSDSLTKSPLHNHVILGFGFA